MSTAAPRCPACHGTLAGLSTTAQPAHTYTADCAQRLQPDDYPSTTGRPTTVQSEPLDLAAIEARYSAALDASVVAIRSDVPALQRLTDAVADVPDLLADVKRLRAQLADGERRGAEKALRDAARSVYNGAPDLEASRGRFHIQSLYNEGASPWLESLADAITNPTPEDTP